LEENGFIKKGTLLVADNILFPGVPEFVKYITESPHYKSEMFPIHSVEATQRIATTELYQ
jgi:catechol O-methyltransferase